jgi:hypothetical protein
MTCNSCSLQNGFGKKRKVNPDAKKAMKMMYSEKITLGEAWKRVKSGKSGTRKKSRKGRSGKRKSRK